MIVSQGAARKRGYPRGGSARRTIPRRDRGFDSGSTGGANQVAGKSGIRRDPPTFNIKGIKRKLQSAGRWRTRQAGTGAHATGHATSWAAIAIHGQCSTWNVYGRISGRMVCVMSVTMTHFFIVLDVRLRVRFTR